MKTVSASSLKEDLQQQRAEEDFAALRSFNFKMVVREKDSVLFKHPSGHSSFATYAFPQNSSRFSRRNFKDVKVGDSLSFSWISGDRSPGAPGRQHTHEQSKQEQHQYQKRGKSAHENALIPSRMKKRKVQKQPHPHKSSPQPSLFTKQLFYRPIKRVYDLKEAEAETSRRKIATQPKGASCTTPAELAAKGVKVAPTSPIRLLPNLKKKASERKAKVAPLASPLLSLHTSFNRLFPQSSQAPNKPSSQFVPPTPYQQQARPARNSEKLRQENLSI